MRKIISGSLLLLGCLSRLPVMGQSVYAPLNNDYYHLLERYEIKHGRPFDEFHSNIKPYNRQVIAQFADSLAASEQNWSKQDLFNIWYLCNDNWEWADTSNHDNPQPLLKTFFKKKSDFYNYRDKEFDLHVSPVLYLGLGYDNNNENVLINSRGIELRGSINRKVGFYTFLTDTQATLPIYVQQQIKAFDAVPGEGFYKDGDRAVPEKIDFLTARGYISFKATKNIDLQFGHDKNFIGNGYRSLILSDYSSNYLFLKLNTRIWKINYQNIFSQMTARVLNADGLRPKKYFTMHHLSAHLTKNLNVGIFESVVFGERDTVSNNNFDLNYLNPIILYRFVEGQLGSPDNVLLGADLRWNFLQRFGFYAQFVLDELVIRELRNNQGWWGNKYAIQVGLKYIDAFGINNLDLQGEANIVRPFTYSQENAFKSYTNYQQPLAHPLGANFYELVGVARYQPAGKWQITGKLFYQQQGLDGADSLGGVQNYGANIQLNNRTRLQEYGNTLTQGIAYTGIYGDFTLTWQPWHNVFIDLKQVVRRLDTQAPNVVKNTAFTSLSLRWNITQRLHEF